MPHRFSLGQSVTYTAGLPEPFASGRYIITQLLPAELGEFQYTARREKTGELRRVRETQLKPLPAPVSSAQSPRRGLQHRPTTRLAAATGR